MRQILIVDDNPGDIDLLRRALTECDYPVDVRAAENAVQAFVFLRRKLPDQLPDVIVLDHYMPIFCGIRTLQCLRESETLRSVPVIMYTSSLLESDRMMALQAGATYVMAKPLTWKGTLDMARMLMGFVESSSLAGLVNSIPGIPPMMAQTFPRKYGKSLKRKISKN